VIFDPQQHAAAWPVVASCGPDIDGVEHVAEMEIAGGSGSESGDDGHLWIFLQEMQSQKRDQKTRRYFLLIF